MRKINFFFYRVQNFEKIKEIARAIMIIIIQNAMLPGPVQMIESDGITLGVSPFLTRMGAKIGGDDVDNRPDVSCISVFDHIRSTIGKVNLWDVERKSFSKSKRNETSYVLKVEFSNDLYFNAGDQTTYLENGPR